MRKQDEVVAARPDIDERVSQLVSKGRWQVPGYKVCAIASVTFTKKLTVGIGTLRRSFCAIIGESVVL